MKPASLLDRLLACVFDLGLWSALAVPTLAPPGVAILMSWPRLADAQASGAVPPMNDLLVFLVLSVLFVGLLLLWCAGFDAYCYRFERRYGATLGKAYWGLVVRDAASGALPSRKQCLWREVTRPFEVGGILPAALAIALDGRRRRLGDRIAGTEVVEGPSEIIRSAFPWLSLGASDYRMAPVQGPGSFVRRAAAFLIDVGVVLVALSPFDLAFFLWQKAPALADALAGDATALSQSGGFLSLGWLAVPIYVFYEHATRRRCGETFGRKLVGLRREQTAGFWRSAVLSFLLLPLTAVEGVARSLARKPGAPLSDRLVGNSMVGLKAPTSAA